MPRARPRLRGWFSGPNRLSQNPLLTTDLCVLTVCRWKGRRRSRPCRENAPDGRGAVPQPRDFPKLLRRIRYFGILGVDLLSYCGRSSFTFCNSLIPLVTELIPDVTCISTEG